MGSGKTGFHQSKNKSGYVSTNTQAGCTHDTFQVDSQGNVKDYHSSASAKGGKILSQYHKE